MGVRSYVPRPDSPGLQLSVVLSMKAKALVKYLVGSGGARNAAALPAGARGVNHAVAACRLLCGRDPTEQELAELGSTSEPMRALRYFLARPDHENAFNQIIATQALPRGRDPVEPDQDVVVWLSACGILDRSASNKTTATWVDLIRHLSRHVASLLKPDFRAAKKRCRLALWALDDAVGAAAKQREVYAYLLTYYLNLYKYFDENWYRGSGAMSVEGPASPLEHYMQVGAARGLAPNAFFDPAFYRGTIGREIPPYRPDISTIARLAGWRAASLVLASSRPAICAPIRMSPRRCSSRCRTSSGSVALKDGVAG